MSYFLPGSTTAAHRPNHGEVRPQRAGKRFTLHSPLSIAHHRKTPVAGKASPHSRDSLSLPTTFGRLARRRQRGAHLGQPADGPRPTTPASRQQPQPSPGKRATNWWPVRPIRMPAQRYIGPCVRGSAQQSEKGLTQERGKSLSRAPAPSNQSEALS